MMKIDRHAIGLFLPIACREPGAIFYRFDDHKRSNRYKNALRLLRFVLGHETEHWLTQEAPWHPTSEVILANRLSVGLARWR